MMRMFITRFVNIILNALMIGIIIGACAMKVFACESYEECMELGDKWASKDKLSDKQWKSMIAGIDYAHLKAIAYKLDEISKKLGNEKDGTEYYPENAKNPDEKIYVKQMCGDGCVRWFDEAHRRFWRNGEAGSAISCKH